MSRPRTVPPADAFPNPRPRRTMRNRERQSKRLLRSRAKRTMRNRKRRSKRLLRPRARAGERIRAAPTRQVSIRPHAREHEPRETCNHFLFDRQLSSSNPCNESSCRAEFCPSGLPGSFTPARVTPPRTFSARSASIREAHPPRKRPPESTPPARTVVTSQPSSSPTPSLPRRLIAPNLSILRGNPPKVTLIF